MQQPNHLRKCSGADPLTLRLALCVCLRAGSHLLEPCKSRTDAKTCACFACFVPLAGGCLMDLSHMNYLNPSTPLCRINNNKPKNLVYESHNVRQLHIAFESDPVELFVLL